MSSPNLITPPVGQEPADFWEVLAATEAFGDRPAVILGDRVVTYPVLRDRALRLAGALAGLGLKPGDAVATLAGNGADHRPRGRRVRPRRPLYPPVGRHQRLSGVDGRRARADRPRRLCR
jgi:hypothetical protein